MGDLTLRGLNRAQNMGKSYLQRLEREEQKAFRRAAPATREGKPDLG